MSSNSSSDEGSLHQFLFDSEYWGSSEWWGEFIFYSIILYIISRNFAKPQESENEKAAKKEIKAGGIKQVGPEHLKLKKSSHMAYTFYCYGGFLTGSHQVYLGNYTYALMYQGTLGFFGLGMIMDFFLLGFHVAKANRYTHTLARTDSFPWRAFFMPLAFMSGLFMMFTTCFLTVPVFAEYYGAIQAYEWPKNPYDVLGVSRGAPMDEVKSNFRKTSMKLHPDRNPECGVECEDKMRELTIAYEIIKKKEKSRKKHEERMEEMGRTAKPERKRDFIDRMLGLNESGDVSDDDRSEAGFLENSVYRAVRGWYLLSTNVFPQDLSAWASNLKKKADMASGRTKKAKKNNAKKTSGNNAYNDNAYNNAKKGSTYGNAGKNAHNTNNNKQQPRGGNDKHYNTYRPHEEKPDSFEDLFARFEL